MRKILAGAALTLVAVGAIGSEPVRATTEIMRRSAPLVVAYDARSGQRRWHLPAERPGHAAVLATTANRVFVERARCLSLDRDNPRDRELVALDARTGDVAWRESGVSSRRFARSERFWYPEGIDAAARVIPIEDAGSGAVVGLDAKSGVERWRVASDGLAPVAATRSSVVVASRSERDSIGASPGAFRIRMLEPLSGRTEWERTITPRSTGVRVVVGPTVVAALSLPASVGDRAFVEILDLETGATIAEASFVPPGLNVYDFAVTADVIAVGGFTGGGPVRTVGLDVATAATRWTVDGSFRFDDPDDAWSLYGSMFGSEPDPQLRSSNAPHVGKLDTRTGALVWGADAPGYVVGLSGGTLVVARGAEFDGSYSVLDVLAGIDPDDGKVRWGIVPGPDKSSESERHFPATYTVSSFAGADGTYVSGGCALTALN